MTPRSLTLALIGGPILAHFSTWLATGQGDPSAWTATMRTVATLAAIAFAFAIAAVSESEARHG